MRCLSKGTYFGDHRRETRPDGLVLTDTAYTHDFVDWHYHENAYFTFLLQGGLREFNKREGYDCTPGTLLFHHWQDPHYNIKPPGSARGFHIELEPSWFSRHQVDAAALEGSRRLDDPRHTFLFRQLHLEASREAAPVVLDALLLALFGNLLGQSARIGNGIPVWVGRLREILHDGREPLTLEGLSDAVGLHPVYLSQAFPRYFHTTLGDYIRRLRVERSVGLLLGSAESLTGIAYAVGFSDQSHYIRCFRKVYGVSPGRYRVLCRK